MKTKVEINGYEISIEEMGGNITVKALKDGESVEEFTLGSESESEMGDEQTGDQTQIKGFSEFGGEEHDFQSTEDEVETEMSDEPHAFGEEPDYAGAEESEHEHGDYEESEDEIESEEHEQEDYEESEEEDEIDEDEEDEEDEIEEDEEDEIEEDEEDEEEEDEAPSEPEVKESLKTFESFIKYSKKPTKFRKR